jgi:hypothetical protein
LFLVTPQREISGAVVEGKVLSADQAMVLWSSWCWQPASEGQPWPQLEPGQAVLEGQSLPAPLW